jgi:hypothetical protein
MTGIAFFLLFLTISIVSGRRQVRQLRDVAEEVSSAMDKSVFNHLITFSHFSLNSFRSLLVMTFIPLHVVVGLKIQLFLQQNQECPKVSQQSKIITKLS